MLPRTEKHHFLRRLHELVSPDRYLEIGVQTGTSLALAHDHTTVVGVDPAPQVDREVRRRPNVEIYPQTADDFFAGINRSHARTPAFDLAFIDGMHLIENVVRDLANVEEWMRPGGIIAIDDVLPYDPSIAGRVPLPGDWAGDVWKIWPILAKWRPDLTITMVDVAPTGLMVLQHLDPDNGPATLRGFYDAIIGTWMRDVDAQAWMRHGALEAGEAFAEIGKIYDQLNGG